MPLLLLVTNTLLNLLNPNCSLHLRENWTFGLEVAVNRCPTLGPGDSSTCYCHTDHTTTLTLTGYYQWPTPTTTLMFFMCYCNLSTEMKEKLAVQSKNRIFLVQMSLLLLNFCGMITDMNVVRQHLQTASRS